MIGSCCAYSCSVHASIHGQLLFVRSAVLAACVPSSVARASVFASCGWYIRIKCCACSVTGLCVPAVSVARRSALKLHILDVSEVSYVRAMCKTDAGATDVGATDAEWTDVGATAPPPAEELAAGGPLLAEELSGVTEATLAAGGPLVEELPGVQMFGVPFFKRRRFKRGAEFLQMGRGPAHLLEFC